LASAAHSEAMSESPPADEMSVSSASQEEKEESPKSFEFLPPRDPAANCELLLANPAANCELLLANSVGGNCGF
jgi:hypothetical protein